LLVPPPESGGAFAPDWSRDGRFLMYQVDTPTGVDLWIQPVTETRSRAFRTTLFREIDPKFSPNSKWVAYASNETGAFEVYVAPIGRPGKQRVSTDGGGQLVWRSDGKELFFISGTVLMSAEMKPKGDSLGFSAPRPLFQTCSNPDLETTGSANYDVTADGSRFVFSCRSRDDMKPSITVAIQWFDMVTSAGRDETR